MGESIYRMFQRLITSQGVILDENSRKNRKFQMGY